MAPVTLSEGMVVPDDGSVPPSPAVDRVLLNETAELDLTSTDPFPSAGLCSPHGAGLVACVGPTPPSTPTSAPGLILALSLSHAWSSTWGSLAPVVTVAPFSVLALSGYLITARSLSGPASLRSALLVYSDPDAAHALLHTLPLALGSHPDAFDTLRLTSDPCIAAVTTLEGPALDLPALIASALWPSHSHSHSHSQSKDARIAAAVVLVRVAAVSARAADAVFSASDLDAALVDLFNDHAAIVGPGAGINTLRGVVVAGTQLPHKDLARSLSPHSLAPTATVVAITLRASDLAAWSDAIAAARTLRATLPLASHLAAASTASSGASAASSAASAATAHRSPRAACADLEALDSYIAGITASLQPQP